MAYDMRVPRDAPYMTYLAFKGQLSRTMLVDTLLVLLPAAAAPLVLRGHPPHSTSMVLANLSMDPLCLG